MPKPNECFHKHVSLGYCHIGGRHSVMHGECLDCRAPLIIRDGNSDWQIDQDALERRKEPSRNW